MLIERTLFGEIDKVLNSVERVKDAYHFSQSLGLGKLYVAFSGGKDSVCLYGIVKKAAEQENIPLLEYAEFHYNMTGIDPPELVYFIREHFPFVSRDLYKKSMWQLIVDKRIPPTRLVRYCCRELKEGGGQGRFTITGVRWAESYARTKRGAFEDMADTVKERKILFNDNDKDRRQMEHCLPRKQYVVNPIIDWLDDDVWEFIHRENLPYCKLYNEGFKRLGCIGCPMAGKTMQEYEFERYPKYRQAYIRAFERMIQRRLEAGLETKWNTGEEVMDWWLNGNENKDYRQMELTDESY